MLLGFFHVFLFFVLFSLDPSSSLFFIKISSILPSFTCNFTAKDYTTSCASSFLIILSLISSELLTARLFIMFHVDELKTLFAYFNLHNFKERKVTKITKTFVFLFNLRSLKVFTKSSFFIIQCQLHHKHLIFRNILKFYSNFLLFTYNLSLNGVFFLFWV